jgi:transcriptional regulator with XRE-family HTH domain
VITILKQRGVLFVDKRNNNFDFDFKPIGLAIKQAREAKGITRESLSERIGYAPRHIQAVENEGQVPSVELFIQLVTMFDISIDEYIFKDKHTAKSSIRRRVDTLLDKLTDKELTVVEGTAKGLNRARELSDK